MSRQYEIIYAGSPDFALAPLAALQAAGHQIKLVLTQADKAAGRGQNLRPTPVKAYAEAHGLPVLTPAKLSLPSAEREQLLATDCDFLITAAYGQLLPSDVLAIPRQKALNIHASLLPRYRGAAPIQAALMHGDSETGVSIIEMVEALDAGDIYYQRRLPIEEGETGGSLFKKLAALSAETIVACLEAWPELSPEPQDPRAVSHTQKLSKAMGRIDWTESAEAIDRRIRAVNPWPSAQTCLSGELYKIWSAVVLPKSDPLYPELEAMSAGREAGALCRIGKRLFVSCGRGYLELLELQRAGQKRLPAETISHNLSPTAAFAPCP